MKTIILACVCIASTLATLLGLFSAHELEVRAGNLKLCNSHHYGACLDDSTLHHRSVLDDVAAQCLPNDANFMASLVLAGDGMLLCGTA